MERIQQLALQNQTTFMNAAELAVIDEELRPAARRAIGEFVQIIRDASTYEGDLRNVVEMIVEKAGIIEAYQLEGTDEARGRIENIQELLGVVDEFTATHGQGEPEDIEESAGQLDNVNNTKNDVNNIEIDVKDSGDAEIFFAAPTAGEGGEGQEPERILRGDSLADFIEWVRLRTDLDAAGDDNHAVTLMTVHSSKGLEFDCVFVAGMEESLFPHMNSMGEAAAVEEERRLAYVAITRARKYLCLTCASQRQLFGSTHANPVSRFLREIPSELRQTTGVGSAGFSGTGWEKRGSRRGISGSGTEAGRGRVSGRSSAHGSGERSRDLRSGLSLPDKKTAANTTFEKGDQVDHKTFGRGIVVRVDGDTLHVKFAKSGQTKKLLKDYAPLVKIHS